MLKISLQVRERPDSSLEWQIDFAQRLGLDMIDIHVGGYPRDPEILMNIKQRALRAGLPIGYLGSGGGYTGTDEEIATRIENDKKDVDAAVFLGAPLIRLMSGRPKLDDDDPEATWKKSAAAFQEVADYAAERGIFMGLQNHPPPAAPRGEDILRMLKMVDRDNATHIMDTGQWWGSIGADPRGEFDPNVRHDRAGLLSMANRGPRTDGSQFFLTFVPTPHLDGKHTVFGRVTDGMDAVDAIEGTETGGGDRPVEVQKIERVDLR